MNLVGVTAGGMAAALAVRLIVIVITLLFGRRVAACRWAAMAGSIVASTMTLAVAVDVLGSGVSIDGVLLHHLPSGITLGYSVTPLSAWFLMVLGLIAIPVALYSGGYFAHAVPPSRTVNVGIAFNVLLGAVETVFVADGVIAFLFAWELMTLATAALVATEHEVRATRRAAYLYLVMSHVGTGCLMAAFFFLASVSGSPAFSTLLAGGVVSGSARHVIFALFFIGFGVKAGVIPLHVWLPEAHPAAPSSVSALMSAVLITAGIYGLFRVCAFGLGAPDATWGLVFMAFGALSAILGVLYAMTQNDVKRLLAYSTIENAGIILLGLGAGVFARAHDRGDLAAVAVAASLYHVLNHAAFKGLLFLGAGGVVMSTGTRKLEEFGGLIRRMPWTGGFFLIGAMAIAGLPPLNGFISEWQIFQALLLGFTATPGLVRLNFPLGGALLALTSALAAACFVRAFGIAFLALPRSPLAEKAHESSPVMLLPQAFLALMCLALGLVPGFVLHVITPVLASLSGLPPPAVSASRIWAMSSRGGFDHVTPAVIGLTLVVGLGVAAALAVRNGRATRRVPTWGCGGVLTARSEYTATAFSKPLIMVFRAIYRPTREVDTLADVSQYFPREVRYRTEIEPTFERYLYGPLTRTVFRTANGMRVLQAGSLHAYLAYVLVLGVLLLIWLGGSL